MGKKEMTHAFRSFVGADRTTYGQRKPICVGKGWGCDKQYQPMNPPNSIANELSMPVEVPNCLSPVQYLEIITNSPGE